MKSVLMSIQPKWCELITNGKKTVEVRKTKPKLETPFKVYIYMTKAYDTLFGYGKPKKLCVDGGKVIGGFVCDKIFDICIEMSKPDDLKGYPFPCTGLTDKEVMQYLGNGKTGYGWHISDLFIYDKPKELNEFKTPPCERPESACENCKYLEVTNTPNAYEVECYRENGVYLTRPPQSWRYVERSENNGE